MGSLVGLAGLMIIFFFIGSLLGIIAYGRSATLRKQVNTLEQKIRMLQEKLVLAGISTGKQETVKKEESPLLSIPPGLKQEIKKEEFPGSKIGKTLTELIEEIKMSQEKTIPGQAETFTILPEILSSESRHQEKKERPALLVKIEKLFFENWTGIIGAIITIVGIGFLGIFTALKLSEIYRFFGIVIISAILIVLSFILKSKTKKWIKLGIWIQSMAAALFLLACAGAGGIPGLKWIENPYIGLGVLCLGILVNLLLAVFGKKEVIASIHTLLSLAALAIAPQNQVIFIIASIVTLCGVLLTFREKWEYHLLFTVFLFFAYIIFHFFTCGELTFSMLLTGTIAISAISILALAVHYRKVYENPAFDPKPFFTHIFTWIFFGIGLFLYVPRVFRIAVPLGFLAVILFLFAHRAKVLKIRWLYAVDLLMSNLIAIIAVLALAEWEISWFSITGILCLESIVFSVIVLIEKDRLLLHCGQGFFYLFLLVFISMNFTLLQVRDMPLLYRNSIFTFIILACITIYHLFSARRMENLFSAQKPGAPGKKSIQFHNILNGLIPAFLLVPLYLNLLDRFPWTDVFNAEYLLLIPVCILIFIGEKRNSRGIQYGIFIPVIVMHIAGILKLANMTNYFWYEKIIYMMPLIIIDNACIWFSFVNKSEKKIIWPGIYLLNIVLFGLSYFVLEPLSPLVPGVAWLVMAVCLLETGRMMRDKSGDAIIAQGSPDIHLIRAGWLHIGAFLLRHILVHLQSERYIWIIKARFLIEAFALLVFLYLAFSKKPEGLKISKTYHALFPILPEIISLFAVLTASVEIDTVYLPIVWIGFAIISLFIGVRWKTALSRFTFYSLFFYWASVIHVGFLTSPLVTPSLSFFDRTWIFSVAAILMQFFFIIFFYQKAELGSVEFPFTFKRMKRLLQFTDKKKNLMIYYPMFISIALFLIWSFDHSILTLLLSLEFFLIFVISIILKESHFRYLSLLGLLCCVIRLVVYDLAASNIFIKAIVCIGVGVLLIGMNALYNRFRGRYKE